MSNSEKMQRVNKSNPCTVCGRPDWCLVAKDGSAAICARIEDGSTKRCGDAGWLHLLDPDSKPTGKPFKRYTPKPAVKIDFAKLAKEYQDRLSERQLRWLGASLGVTPASLQRLGVGFDGKAFTFPMMDENLRVIGIRRRFGDGDKRAVTGSLNGLFIPTGLSGDKPLCITEGETDCAAALDMGFDSVGRPNCNSKVEMTVRFARGKRIVVICDNDVPGRDGAKKLAAELIKHCPSVKVICPPPGVKDLRVWKSKGFNGEQIRYEL
ncbi:MAG: hypothetical protein FVQ82_17570 [Planctomycetes bacterium]|nr:hypothetical protein [Planctomycetota bacterium]